MRILLTGADTAKARPREAGTERWPCFCGLRRFATVFKYNSCQWKANDAKPRKPQKRRKAKKRVKSEKCRISGVPPAQSDSVPKMRNGREGAEDARSKPPSTLPAPPRTRPLCFKPLGTRFRRCAGCPPARESHPRGRGTTNRATRRFSARRPSRRRRGPRRRRPASRDGG